MGWGGAGKHTQEMKRRIKKIALDLKIDVFVSLTITFGYLKVTLDKARGRNPPKTTYYPQSWCLFQLLVVEREREMGYEEGCYSRVCFPLLCVVI